MHRMKLLMVGAVAAAGWACGAGSSPAVDLAVEEESLRARGAELLRFAQANDSAGFAAMFATEGELLEPNGPAHRGREAVAGFSAGMGSLPDFEISWAPMELTLAQAADLAVERGAYELSFDGPDGRVEDNGKYVTVWIKQNGQWLVKHDIFNSSVPMPGM